MNYFKHMIIWCLIFSYSNLHAFRGAFATLQEAHTYGKQIEEYPEIDNKNWLNPDFSSYHRKQLPGFFNRLFSRLRVKKPLWSVRAFKQLLDNTTKKRKLNGYSGNFIQKLTPKPNDTFIIWYIDNSNKFE